MKLIRYGQAGQEKPGIVAEDGTWRDVSALTPDFTEEFFENDGIARLAEWLATNGDSLPEVSQSERIGPPMARCGRAFTTTLWKTSGWWRWHRRPRGSNMP